MKSSLLFLFSLIAVAQCELFPDSDDYFLMNQIMRSACGHAGAGGAAASAPAGSSAQRLATAGSGGGGGGGGGGPGNGLLKTLLIDKLLDLKAAPVRANPGSNQSTPDTLTTAPPRETFTEPEPAGSVDVIVGLNDRNLTANSSLAELISQLSENQTLNGNETISTNGSTVTVADDLSTTILAENASIVTTVSPVPLAEPATVPPSPPKQLRSLDFEAGGQQGRRTLMRIGSVSGRRKRSALTAVTRDNGTFQSIMSKPAMNWVEGLHNFGRAADPRAYAMGQNQGNNNNGGTGGQGYTSGNNGNGGGYSNGGYV